MKPDSNRGERRPPMVVLYLAGAAVTAPFFLLAIALTSLNGAWLMLAVAALPFTVLAPLWFWLRRPNARASNLSMGALAQEAYPPGA